MFDNLTYKKGETFQYCGDFVVVFNWRNGAQYTYSRSGIFLVSLTGTTRFMKLHF